MHAYNRTLQLGDNVFIICLYLVDKLDNTLKDDSIISSENDFPVVPVWELDENIQAIGKRCPYFLDVYSGWHFA